MRQWTIDAFAAAPFRGNPACVVEPLFDWPADAWMQALAAENNQAETAFLKRGDDPARFADLVTREQHLVPKLGVLAITLTNALRGDLGLSTDDAGALAAARATEAAGEYGIQPGDLIVAVNRTRVRSLDDLRGALAKLPARAACALQVLRQGQYFYLAFEIEE